MADHALTFVLDPEVAERFPRHATGLIRVAAAGGAVEAGSEAIAELRERYVADPRPAAAAAEHWSAVFREMNAKPKYLSSIARLREMASEDGIVVPVPTVELYCWFSLVAGVPMAGYRPDRLAGDLRLAVPPPGSPFTPLGNAKGSPEKTKPGEVAYVDGAKVICRYWNYRDCDQTKLEPGLEEILFVFDLVDGLNQDFDALAGDFASYFSRADVTSVRATPAEPTVTLAGGSRTPS